MAELEIDQSNLPRVQEGNEHTQDTILHLWNVKITRPACVQRVLRVYGEEKLFLLSLSTGRSQIRVSY